MYKMWFSTGVRPVNRNFKMDLMEHQAWRGGVLQIAFYLEHEPPENWHFKFASPYILEDEPNRIKIVGGGLFSEWAYFNVYPERKNDTTV